MQWARQRMALNSDARTNDVALSLHGSARVFGLRAFAQDVELSSRLCFQLEDVVVDDSAPWVGNPTSDDFGDFCTRCSQRVSVGAGYGLFVLPSSDDDSSALGEVRLRVALRDCTTLTPLSAAEPQPMQLVIDHAAWVPPPPGMVMRLPLTIVLASPIAFESEPALLQAALQRARSVWLPAGIDLDFADPIEIDPPASAVEYSTADRRSLSLLAHRARAALPAQASERAWPVVVIAPCLRRTDVVTSKRSEPLATTPHIPSGSGVYDEADMIFVAGERCAGLEPAPNFSDATTLGVLIAHELGHFLGLYHVLEADGRADALHDTESDALNLMRAVPSASALELTPSQIRVVRRQIPFAGSATPPP